MLIVATERDPIADAAHLIMEPFNTLSQQQLMLLDLWKIKEQTPRTLAPTLLVPGALGSKFDLELPRQWYKKEGFSHVVIADIATTGPILPQGVKLAQQLQQLAQPAFVIAYSSGVVAALAAAHLAADKILALALVDGPVIPPDRTHFNFWGSLMPVNDIYSPEVAAVLSLSIPQGLKVFSFARRDNGTVAYEASVRPDVTVVDLPGSGHHSLYYDPKANGIIADTMCPRRE